MQFVGEGQVKISCCTLPEQINLGGHPLFFFRRDRTTEIHDIKVEGHNNIHLKHIDFVLLIVNYI